MKVQYVSMVSSTATRPSSPHIKHEGPRCPPPHAHTTLAHGNVIVEDTALRSRVGFGPPTRAYKRKRKKDTGGRR